MNEQRPCICIIDDDDAVRESLRILLFASGYRSVLFSSADEFLEQEDHEHADAYLLDLQMPGMNGDELHKTLLQKGDTTPVIFITGHGDIPLAVAAIQRGAFDFLAKPFEHGELISKIEKAVEASRSMRDERAGMANLRECYESLTPRERDVLELLIEGHPNKGVASALSISPRTVEIHRARVMEKMGADSIAELVRLCTQLEGFT